MDGFLQDLRYALRALRRSPGYATVAIATLAIGIGVNTTVFSVVNALLLRPPPHVRTDGLLTLRERQTNTGGTSTTAPATFLDWERRTTSFEGFAAHFGRGVILSGPGGEPEPLEAVAVTADLFEVLGARPALGRTFAPDEGEDGKRRVVVLAHRTWAERFAADPGIVGRTVTIDGAAHTVIGVMPERFGFPESEAMWLPIDFDYDPTARGSRYLGVVARAKPGVTPAQAAAELDAVAAQLERESPETNARWRVETRPFVAGGGDRDVIRTLLLAMLGAVGFVLLIACANVANLSLARAAGRRREIAVRMALGARRGRLVRQLLTESAVVAVLGGVVGIGIAQWGLAAIVAAFPVQPPPWMYFDVDGRVLAFTLAVSLLTGLGFGVAPALQSTRAGLGETLKDGTRGTTAGGGAGRLRAGLVVAELALAMVLLIGASLMMRSFLALQGADPGFRPEGVLSARVTTGGPRYGEEGAANRFFAGLLEGAAALPGAAGAALVTEPPLGDVGVGSAYDVQDRPRPPEEQPRAETRGVSAAYFSVLGIPLVRGRGFRPEEVAEAADVAVVNRTLAAEAWGDADPVGRRLRIGGDWLTVVGVVEDQPLRGLDRRAEAQLFLPFTARWNDGAVTVLVRGAGDPARLAGPLRRAVRALDPGVPVHEVRTMEAVVHRSLWQRRLFGGMFASFGAIALLLAVTGVYATMAYAVSQRTHEIGVRVALGARAGDVLRLVVRQGVGMTALGVGLGLLAALGVTRVLATVLWGVSPTDPLTFAGVSLLLASVAVTASWLPARRAARVDPMVALRTD